MFDKLRTVWNTRRQAQKLKALDRAAAHTNPTARADDASVDHLLDDQLVDFNEVVRSGPTIGGPGI